MRTHIICLLSSLIGDENNARGVARSTADLYASETVIMHEVKAGKLDEADALIRTFEDGDRVVVVGAGEDGLDASLALKGAFKDKIYTSWSGHQLPEGRDISSIDRVNLPRGLASNVLKISGRLTETTGVPHNLIKADLEAERLKWADRLPVTDKKKLVVILGGDAPLDGVQKFYTAKEAEELADYVADQARAEGYYVYVTNGPRTGKFNTETKAEDETVHRGDAALSTPTDPVSAAFVSQLKSKGFEDGRDFYFADFRHGTPATIIDPAVPSISAYKPFLGSLGVSDLLVLPGESTSMFSETLGVIDNRIGYITGSMNGNHHASFAGFQKESPIAVLSLPTATGKMELAKSTLISGIEAPEPAVMTVAKAIQADLSITPTLGLHK